MLSNLFGIGNVISSVISTYKAEPINAITAVGGNIMMKKQEPNSPVVYTEGDNELEGEFTISMKLRARKNQKPSDSDDFLVH